MRWQSSNALSDAVRLREHEARGYQKIAGRDAHARRPTLRCRSRVNITSQSRWWGKNQSELSISSHVQPARQTFSHGLLLIRVSSNATRKPRG